MRLDILDALENAPPTLDFVWNGFVAGTVGALVAPGGAGKSFWALQFAMSVAAGSSDADTLRLRLTKSGKVRYIASEDPIAALKQRLHAIGRHINSESYSCISNFLTITSTLGSCFDIMKEETLESLIRECKGHRLIIFDTLSRIHILDENSNGDMARLLSQLEKLAVETEAGVLFLHHVSKSSVRNGATISQQAARGASSLIDNARWCSYISAMSEKEFERFIEPRNRFIERKCRHSFVKLGVNKQNYSGASSEQWYERQTDGVLRPIELLEKRAPSASTRRGSRRHEA